MGGRKKKFIEKNEGVKFHLVHRSQRDPLYLDETLGDHVLMPVDPDNEAGNKLAENLNGLKLHHSSKSRKEMEDARMKRAEEQQKFGIYYVDDYDYLQHLRHVDYSEEAAGLEKETATKSAPIKVGSVVIKSGVNVDDRDTDAMSTNSADSRKLQLPSSVFASKFEEEVGYFNQAAPDSDPKINWDPDVVRLLDEDVDIDFDSAENQLEDDFFVKANAEGDDAQEDEDDEGTLTENSDNDDDGDSFNGGRSEDGDQFSETQSMNEYENKSRFSTYSMSSSVVRRNEALKDIDQHFEKFFEQYDEDQIGALDTEDIEGFRKGNDLVLESALQEFNKFMQKKYYTPEAVSKPPKMAALAEEEDDTETESDFDSDDEDDDDGDDNCDENNNKREYETVKLRKKKEREDRLDCESIISTYSNIYNRPAVISEKTQSKKKEEEEKSVGGGTIELSAKTGLPLGVLPEKPMGKREMNKIEHKITRILPEIQPRTTHETKEDKRARKQAVKEHRRERRVEKKINKLAFKAEKKVQIGQLSNMQELSRTVKLPL